jgi:hypothetical protein
MNRKLFPVFASLFLLLVACAPENGVPAVFVVSETPTWYPSLTPIRTPTPTLVPTDTPLPPTYTPVVMPTQDILERFCQSDDYNLSPYWSCSCGNHSETRLQDDYITVAEVFLSNRSLQPGLCDVSVPQGKYELTLPDTWYCAAHGHYLYENLSCVNQSRESFGLRYVYSEVPAHIADQAIAIIGEGGWTSYKPVVGSNENVVWREAKSVQSRLVIRMLSQVDGNNIILRYFFKHENRVYVFATKYNEMEHLLAMYNFDFDSPDFAAYIELFESAIASMRFAD